MVFVHNQTSKPVPSEGIRVNPGSLTTIILSKILTHSEPAPYSDCKDLTKHKFDRVFYEAIRKSNFSYTQTECVELCLQQSVIKKCLCYHLRYLKLGADVLPCLSKSELECTEREYLSFIDNDIDETWKDYCPLECDSEYFEFKISSSHFPTAKYKNILSRQPGDQESQQAVFGGGSARAECVGYSYLLWEFEVYAYIRVGEGYRLRYFR